MNVGLIHEAKILVSIKKRSAVEQAVTKMVGEYKKRLDCLTENKIHKQRMYNAFNEKNENRV